jgi:hypothetical protein
MATRLDRLREFCRATASSASAERTRSRREGRGVMVAKAAYGMVAATIRPDFATPHRATPGRSWSVSIRSPGSGCRWAALSQRQRRARMRPTDHTVRILARTRCALSRMKNTAIATRRDAIMITQPTQKLGSIVPKIARLTIAAVPRVGNPSAGQMVSQPSHVRIAAAAPRGLSI